MRVLITGAAGFVGANTVKFLLKRNWSIMAVDNFSTGKSENLKELDGDRIKIVDIRDETLMDLVFKQFRPDVVLHLAAQSAITTAWNDPNEDLSVNSMGTISLLQLSIKYAVKKFVFSSTSAVYGKSGIFSKRETDRCSPDTPYGVSKLASEFYIRMFFPNHVILRYANIYGPLQQPIGKNQVIARAFRHYLFGDDFQVFGDGRQKRDYVFVEDIAAANYLAMVDETIGTFNVSSGKSYSVNQVLSEIEKAYEVPGYKWEHTKENDPRGDVFLNPGLIRKTLGWRPYVSLKEGIQATKKWWSK